MSQSATPHRASPTAEHGELYSRLDAGAVVEAVSTQARNTGHPGDQTEAFVQPRVPSFWEGQALHSWSESSAVEPGDGQVKWELSVNLKLGNVTVARVWIIQR